ncbi:hypothetical protein BH24GEM2_BH24GEM2_18510 [soil metagenome]
MDKRAATIHVLICLAAGVAISFFVPVKWLAAAFWVSAVLFLNGSLAYYEDARPRGFENATGGSTPEFAKGIGAVAFWTKSIAVAAALGAAGYGIQVYA